MVRLDGRGQASRRGGSKSGDRQCLQRRFEGSAVGEALIGALIALVLLLGSPGICLLRKSRTGSSRC